MGSKVHVSKGIENFRPSKEELKWVLKSMSARGMGSKVLDFFEPNGGSKETSLKGLKSCFGRRGLKSKVLILKTPKGRFKWGLKSMSARGFRTLELQKRNLVGV